MTEPKMVTEREARMRERAAYCEGVRDNESAHRASLACKFAHNLADLQRDAAMLYPLPKIVRPRVVCETTIAWTVERGEIKGCGLPCCGSGGLHFGTFVVAPTPERVKLWADLLANPTEEVEEGSQ